MNSARSLRSLADQGMELCYCLQWRRWMVYQREGDGGLQLGVALVLGRGTFHPVR